MADNGGSRRRADRRWLWICAGVAAAGAVVAVLGIWYLPGRMYPGSGTEVVQAQAALQGGLLTAAAALTAVAGGLIALDETRRANANTHVRELYVEAARLLNDPDNLGIRLAGIYALERIAVDSPADQSTVVEVLSAFVRTRSTDLVLRPPPPADSQDPPPVQPAADIRAAVQVLGRLPVRGDVPRCDLTGADLTGPASLTGLILTEAHLADAWLEGADLTGAQLGWATLAGARLRGADLTGAQLFRAALTWAQLRGANLTGAWLDEADLTGAWLEGADLTGAQLSDANLTGARLDGADLTRAQLDRATLAGAELCGARGLVAVRVAAAFGNAGTRLPDGVERPGSWPPYDPSARRS